MGKLEFSWFEFPNHAKNREHWGFLINWPRGGTERVRRTVALEDCQQTFSGVHVFLTVQAEGGSRGTRIWWWRRQEWKLRTGDLRSLGGSKTATLLYVQNCTMDKGFGAQKNFCSWQVLLEWFTIWKIIYWTHTVYWSVQYFCTVIKIFVIRIPIDYFKLSRVEIKNLATS